MFDRQQIVDKLRWLSDIATDSDLIRGAIKGDRPTVICRRLKRLTYSTGTRSVSMTPNPSFQRTAYGSR